MKIHIAITQNHSSEGIKSIPFEKGWLSKNIKFSLIGATSQKLVSLKYGISDDACVFLFETYPLPHLLKKLL